MKLTELFDSRDKKKRLSHIRNLVILSVADGTLDKSEFDLIFNIGIEGGLTPDELQRILSRPHSIKFQPPDSFHERIEQLYDMVLVMMADGEIHENEVLFCKMIAVKLGFTHHIIEKMVQDTITLIAEGVATDIAISQLMQYAE